MIEPVGTEPLEDIDLLSRTETSGGATLEELEFQLFPHSDTPLHRQDQSSRPFLFSPVEKKICYSTVIQIGRKIDRSKDQPKGTTREDRAFNNVSVDINHLSNADRDPDSVNTGECIAFRSKVVSRHHAELMVGKDGQAYIL